jgi:hypothetical protein
MRPSRAGGGLTHARTGSVLLCAIALVMASAASSSLTTHAKTLMGTTRDHLLNPLIYVVGGATSPHPTGHLDPFPIQRLDAKYLRTSDLFHLGQHVRLLLSNRQSLAR